MRIAIDGRMAHQRAGIGAYVRGLLHGLSLADDKNEYYVVLNDGRVLPRFCHHASSFRPLCTAVSYRDHFRRDLWEQVVLPAILRRLSIDVYHGPNFIVPLLSRVRKVVTVFDAIRFVLPGQSKYSLAETRVRWLSRMCARNAQIIITGSEHSKQDLVRILGIPAEKIRVIYAAPDPSFDLVRCQSPSLALLQKYHLERRYIISVGSVTPRKNFGRLVRAYSELPENLKKEYQLVIVGKKGSDFPTVHKIVRQLGIEDRVVFTGEVTEEELPALLAGAKLFVFPSLYEGFGIPPLEAMRCGTPVIASKASSIPEVVGDAALLFDPYNPAEISRAIERVLLDERVRETLVRKGSHRLTLFSWRKAGEETLAVYEEICAKEE